MEYKGDGKVSKEEYLKKNDEEKAKIDKESVMEDGYEEKEEDNG